MSKKTQFIDWLYRELPELVTKGVITSETGEAIKSHYGPVKKTTRISLILAVFAVIGALLIGLGIILIFAYNWDLFSRIQKVMISFIPLLVSWYFVVKCKKSEREKMGPREGAAVFNIAALASTIAIISQAYHLPGELDSFLLVWMLLAWPMIYLLDSCAACLLYLMGLTYWAGSTQSLGGHAAAFWPLALISFPFLIKRIKMLWTAPSLASHWLLWAVCVCFTVALGVVMEKVIPGLWMITYSSFFATLFLAGSLYGRFPDGSQMPFRRYGLVGIVVLTYVMTYLDWWKDIGIFHYRSGAEYDGWAALLDYFLLGVFFSITVMFLKQFLKKENMIEGLFGFLPVLVLVFFLLDHVGTPDWVPTAFLNFYLLAIGVFALYKGYRQSRMLWFNGGLVVLGVLIWTRFIDYSMDLLTRAFVFILFGIIFLVANKVIAKRMEKKA